MESSSQHSIEKTENIGVRCYNNTKELIDDFSQKGDLIALKGKKLVLVDESKNYWEMQDGLPEDSVEAIIWNTKSSNRIPITVYRDGQKVYWFNINNNNITNFKISF